MNKPTKKEKFFIVKAALFLFVLVLIPYLYGFWATPENTRFIGNEIISLDDLFVYYSYMEQVEQGSFLFEDLFTTEAQAKNNFNLFWLAAGLIFKVISNKFIALQIIKLFLIVGLCFALYYLISVYWQNVFKRKLTFWLAVLAGGLGYYSYFLFDGASKAGYLNLPIDLWVTESNLFLILKSASPHFIASAALLIFIFYKFLISIKTGASRDSAISGLAALVLFLFHPYYLPYVLAVLAVFVLCESLLDYAWPKQSLKSLSIILIFSGLAGFYHFYLLFFDPIANLRGLQNFTLTPPPLNVVLGFGLILVLSVSAVFLLIKNKLIDKKILFLIVWLAVGLALIYLPINYQRRFLEALVAPMAVLAGFFIFYLRENKNLDFKLLAVLLLFSVVGSLGNYAYHFKSYHDPRLIDYAYIDKEILKTADYLKENTLTDSIILAPCLTAKVLPAFAGRKTYCGHWAETINPVEKQKKVEDFYQGRLSAEKFVRENNIDYVIFDFAGLNNFQPQAKNYFTLFYKNQAYSVFQVK